MSLAIACRTHRCRGGFIVTRVCTASWAISQQIRQSILLTMVGLEGSVHVSQRTQCRCPAVSC
ncbi:hypothetical protein K469DRAFT_702454 [Zopfia rhizophila CBS 207.26]|uniref:Uncharacterized protein n=1 Tax=Zopfia rhizophila CBS 207.26 TaxID=1314779 RepID=A0A6A6EA79_9PEZI|nr:hypothetical protein K469DRAFT_702454 [Zopfia rhizophila CBS 207.26]